jgi:hypothetical protein
MAPGVLDGSPDALPGCPALQLGEIIGECFQTEFAVFHPVILKWVVTLAELNPAADTFDADCEDVAAQFLSENPEFNHGLTVAVVRHIARTSGPAFKQDAFHAILTGIVVLPFIDPALSHYCGDVAELKGHDGYHFLFHQPREVAIETLGSRTSK